jgi:hypothetical protein
MKMRFQTDRRSTAGGIIYFGGLRLKKYLNTISFCGTMMEKMTYWLTK